MNFLSPLRACVLATAILMMMIACNNNSSPANQAEEKESVIEQVQKRGALRVGMSTFVPWAMKDKTGNLIGFEIDVAKRLAKDTGVNVEFIPTKWSGIIPENLTSSSAAWESSQAEI